MSPEPNDGMDPAEEEHPQVPELSSLTPPQDPGLVEPVLSAVRRRESMAYMVAFAWGGVLEIVQALGEWLTSLAKLQEDHDYEGSTDDPDDSL